MKECVIVQYYVRNYNDEYILNKCIDSYKKMNLDIILISHSTISETIQKKVKYFLYDSDDELITFDDAFYNPKVIMDTVKRLVIGDKMAHPFLYVVDDMAYTFYKAVLDIYKFAYNMGYDYSYYFIGDSYIDDEDVKKIIDIRNNVLENKKLGYFEIYWPKDHLSPFFWYVNNEWFLNNCFPNLSTKEIFLSNLETFCVYERIFYKYVIVHKDSLILKNVDDLKLSFLDNEKFDLSKKYDQSGGYNDDIGLFYGDDNLLIISFNFTTKTKNWRMTIEYDDKYFKYDISITDCWNILPIPDIQSNYFRLRCEDMDKKKILYDVFIKDKLKYKGTFKFENIENFKG
jgi:hypothetical protein